jgi:hypothetical protein
VEIFSATLREYKNFSALRSTPIQQEQATMLVIFESYTYVVHFMRSGPTPSAVLGSGIV